VALGAVLAIVSLTLYFTMSGQKKAEPSLKALAVPLLSTPEPHVLRIAIDWPPKAPPEIKTVCHHLQWRPHEA
jgi:hypothetical protein